jgi:tRNA pseudouridine55 synthase
MNKPAKRKRVPVHGVLLLDKPAGLSSTQALAKAKWLLNAEKAGHTGTLDPFATGLLPLCFGEATKFAQDLLEADKTYEAIVHLGVTTTTGDTEGEVIGTMPVDVSEAQIEAVLAKFRGPIKQVPPMYSALKRDGKPLYEYAREGVILDRDAREIVIHALELLSYDAPMLSLRVACSKGTYIRVLGEDIGMSLGCGAHLNALRRTEVGGLTVNQSVTLERFEAISDVARSQALAPVDALLSNFPTVELNEELARRFLHGQRLSLEKEGIAPPVDTGRVKVVAAGGRLLGTAHLLPFALLAPERLVHQASQTAAS